MSFSVKGKLPWSGGKVRAVDGVSFECAKGDVLGIVGESGCGKSTLANMIMRVLLPTEGRVVFNGQGLADRSRAQVKELCRSLQMVFQDPYSSLNPMISAGANVMEPLRIQGIDSPSVRRQKALAMMEEVGLRENFFERRPSEFSGGQRQRIAIARALVLKPQLVLLDEPVSSLDVSIQAQVINLLLRLRREFDLTYIFVSHDLAVVRYLCNRIAVMYLGKVVEIGPSKTIVSSPRHPYSRALLDALPLPDPRKRRGLGEVSLKGEVPSPVNPPKGCRFHPRCPQSQAKCEVEEPPLVAEAGASGRSFACHYPLKTPVVSDGLMASIED